MAAQFSLLRLKLAKAGVGELIEDAEFLFAEALIHNERRFCSKSATHSLRRLPCSDVWRGEDHIWLVHLRHFREPAAKRVGLTFAALTKANICIADFYFDPRPPGSVGIVTRHIPGALAVPYDPKPLWPTLHRSLIQPPAR
jgi:hypothetical protein